MEVCAMKHLINSFGTTLLLYNFNENAVDTFIGRQNSDSIHSLKQQFFCEGMLIAT